METPEFVRDEAGARRSVLRLRILGGRNINPRSPQGQGARRWKRAQARLHATLSQPALTLGEYQALTKWALTTLGFTFERQDGVWDWRRYSKAATRRKERWDAVLAQAREELPDWCHTTPELEREARQLLA